MRTEVAIIGAGPAGLLLSHLLAADGRRVGGRRDPLGGVRRVADPGRHPRAVHGRPAARHRARRPARRARATEHRRHLPAVARPRQSERHHLDFVDLTGRSVWVYGQTEVQKDLVAAAHAPRAGDPLRGQPTPRCTTSRPTGRRSRSPTPPAAPSGSTPTWSSAATGPSGRPAAAMPDVGAADVGEGLPLLVARRPRRRRTVDRRADLRLAPGRLRDALDALGDGLAALPPGAQRDRRSTTGPTTGSGRRWPPGSVTARTAGR